MFFELFQYKFLLVIFWPMLNYDKPMYLFTQPFHYEKDVTQDQFLSGVQLVWSRFSFSSSNLKNPVHPAIYS